MHCVRNSCLQTMCVGDMTVCLGLRMRFSVSCSAGNTCSQEALIRPKVQWLYHVWVHATHHHQGALISQEQQQIADNKQF